MSNQYIDQIILMNSELQMTLSDVN
jgi:hypothetical protein